MKKLIAMWKQRRVRRAREKYAMWKARYEEGQRQLADTSLGAFSYADNPFNRNRVIKSAGKAALYLERVEELMRFPLKPEHPQWIKFKLTDESWAEWRKENPEEVEALKKLASSN